MNWFAATVSHTEDIVFAAVVAFFAAFVFTSFFFAPRIFESDGSITLEMFPFFLSRRTSQARSTIRFSPFVCVHPYSITSQRPFFSLRYPRLILRYFRSKCKYIRMSYWCSTMSDFRGFVLPFFPMHPVAGCCYSIFTRLRYSGLCFAAFI